MRSGERWQAESPGAVANVILSNIAELAWDSGSGYDSGARVNLLETPDVIRAAVPPNDPSSATRPARRVNCNREVMAGFAAAHG